MSTARHKITNRNFTTIESWLSGKEGDSGKTFEDNRKFLNAALWIIGTGCP